MSRLRFFCFGELLGSVENFFCEKSIENKVK